MEELITYSADLIDGVDLSFQRYLYKDINWSNRLIGIKGSRGTGKTTLLLQWLKQQDLAPHQEAYFSLDNLYFSSHSLLETATAFYKSGGKVLVLDEVHKYRGWSREIKNVYDHLSKLQIIFTGSSILDIVRQEADLSRRALMYELPGLSFREYLIFENILEVAPVSLADLVAGKNLRKAFPADFRPLEHFKKYLQKGYYPFAHEDPEGYYQRLQQLVRSIVEYDMAELKDFDIRNAKKMLQLLYIIAQQVPFKPNLSKLAEKSNIHRNSLSNYLLFLEQAKLIKLLYPAGTSIATLQKPEKIFLENPNLMNALAIENPNIGAERETFFLNQISVKHRVSAAKTADFEVDGQYIFEIGGKAKTRKQIENLENAFLIKDDLEDGVGSSLPLWQFGLLY